MSPSIPRRGFAVLAAAMVCACTAPAALAGNSVYWSNRGTASTISFANLDESGGADLSATGATGKAPFGVALDPAGGRAYWAGFESNTISFTNLDGSGGGNLATGAATVNGPIGVAVDPVAGRIYWANHNANKISFANLNGTGGGDLATGAATVIEPFGVAVDPTAGRIYWANAGANKLSFAKLDGTGGADISTGGVTVSHPIGVAVDPVAGRIYWANFETNKISFANLDGTGGGDLNTSGATTASPEGVALDPGAGRIYWGNPGGKISFARLDGTGGGDLNTFGATGNFSVFPALLETPSATGTPAITGGSSVGSSLSCSNGSWASDALPELLYRAPRTFAYQWSLNGSNIAGASGSSVTAAAPGEYRCRVTAENQAGPSSQSSAGHTVVAPTIPTPLPPPTLLPPPTPSPRKATISQLRESNSVFAVGVAATPVTGATTARRPRRGTTFSFRLDQAATVTIALRTQAPGRRVGRLCKPESPKLHTKRHCIRTVAVGTITRTAHAGLNKVVFSGRVGRKPLSSRRYQAVFIATDSAGSSAPQTLIFTIVKG
jgi:DNA-binding beta-propeller fold protein YncE